MAKKKGAKRDKVSKKSKGMSRACRARQQLQRVRMKITRWKRYSQEERTAIEPRRQGWDTTKLEKHANFLESVIKRGSTTW